MRFRSLIPVLWIVVAATATVADKTLEQKIEEKRAKAERMDKDDRGRIYSELAVHQADLASTLFTAGDSDKGKQAVADAVTFAKKASDSAKIKKNNIKQTEIHLRECSRRLEELARTVTFLDRDPIKQAAKKVEDLRSELLTVMFAPKSND
jgi:hypothetical protein